jgi:hypothetical protein
MNDSTAQTVTQMPTGRSQALSVGEAVLKGKIVGKRKGPGSKFYEHLIVMPAPDPYSSPSTVLVLGETSLGDREEDVTVRVKIAGYKRSYKTTDRDTGEMRSVQTADVRLFAITA